MQEGCGYKDTLSRHRYFARLAKYFTVCITYQPPLVHYNYCALMVCRSNSDVLILCYNYCAHMVCRPKSDVLMLCYNFVPSWSTDQTVMS